MVEGLVGSIMDGARAELTRVLEFGGAVAAVESGYLKSALVSSLAARQQRIESGDDIVVGVNRFVEAEPSPLNGADAIVQVDPAVEAHAVEAMREWRSSRDASKVEASLARLKAAADSNENLMPATLECVRAGVTTGEWAGALREVFGEYRAPTGIATASATLDPGLGAVRERLHRTAGELGKPTLRLLVGKPGLDGHSNGAEQIAVRARDAGFEVVYQGIRLTPQQIVAAAVQEDVDVVGLSVLSGAHLRAVPAVLNGLKEAGMSEVPVVVGGIIPEADAEKLRDSGVARVFTPKDFALTGIMDELVNVVREANGCA